MDAKSYVLSFFTFVYSLRLISAGILQNLVDVKGNNGIKQIRILYYQQESLINIPTIYPLIRGLPLFAEIDFLPRYIPQLTYYVSVTVALPEKIRGKQWILGWHQEVFQLPQCRLCTNTNQSYTMPVTLYLADDGWCAEGVVPTLWKVEAIPLNERDNDQTDMILGFAYDRQKQIRILNSNQTVHCKNRHEIIICD